MEKIHVSKAPFTVAIITLIISTVIMVFAASIGYDSLVIKFNDNKGAEGLAFIILIPLLIILGIALLISSVSGIIATIRSIVLKAYRVPSIIFLVLQSLYLITYITCMVILIL